MAEDAGVDLVEIAPLAQPPVCRIMDYGKFKYAEAKKAHEAKLKQKQIQVKEVKFRPGTDEGDYQIKLRNLVRFLQEGDKTKVVWAYDAEQPFPAKLMGLFVDMDAMLGGDFQAGLDKLAPLAESDAKGRIAAEEEARKAAEAAALAAAPVDGAAPPAEGAAPGAPPAATP